MSAIANSNTVDIQNQEEREKEYLKIAKRYTNKERNRLTEFLEIFIKNR